MMDFLMGLFKEECQKAELDVLIAMSNELNINLYLPLYRQEPNNVKLLEEYWDSVKYKHDNLDLQDYLTLNYHKPDIKKI